MADITWENVTNFLPSMSTVILGEQTDILDYVNHRGLRPDAFGGEDAIDYKRARVYLAAHMSLIMRMSAGGGSYAPVTSESAGGLSRSYATVAGSSASGEWGSTGPGQLLISMIIKTRGPYVL